MVTRRKEAGGGGGKVRGAESVHQRLLGGQRGFGLAEQSLAGRTVAVDLVIALGGGDADVAPCWTHPGLEEETQGRGLARESSE